MTKTITTPDGEVFEGDDIPKTPTFLRTPYNYDMDAASYRSGLVTPEPSLAVQSERDDADINTIVARFGLTGQMPTNLRVPTYGDFTGVADMRDALEAIHYANEAFMQLPAPVRARFNHDAASFVDFCSNPANLPEMKSMGLTAPETPRPAPLDVRVVPPPPDGSSTPSGASKPVQGDSSSST